MHLLVDSHGLRLGGAGECPREKHGTRTRRSWRKLHAGVDADTGQIVTSERTGHDENDAGQAGPWLDQVAGPIGAVTGDGGYDQESVHAGPGTPNLHPHRLIMALARHSGGLPRLVNVTGGAAVFLT